MERNNERFGDFIKRHREQKGLPLREVARLLDLSPAYICDMEKNRRNPLYNDKLYKLSAILGLTQDDEYWLFDLSARELKKAPYDVEDMFFYTEIGDMCRQALRLTKKGILTIKEWERLLK
jgi:transcriptional regulator with XRE-family HTH domain